MKISLKGKNFKFTNIALAALVLIVSLTACQFGGKNFNVDLSKEKIGEYSSGVSVHDPAIISDNGKYYIFGSHMASAKSNDLMQWEYIGDGYQPMNPVYTGIFSNENKIFDYTGSRTSIIPTDDKNYHVWAPDVIFNKKLNKYMMYASISSTWNASSIALLISDSIEGPYQFEETIVYSGFTEETIDATNVLVYVDKNEAIKRYSPGGKNYNFKSYPNAIDPTVFYAEDESLWMVYGSWSGGIFLLEIDESTGLAIRPEEDVDNQTDAYFGKKLIGGGHISIEGPYIYYDEQTGYYYLFVSYGGLARDGGYQMRVFRSDSVNGEYKDMNGEFPGPSTSHLTYGLKLSGNYVLPSLENAYMAPGHNSVFYDKDKQSIFNVFHTRFDGGSEFHEVRVHKLSMNKEAWPVMLPYAYDGVDQVEPLKAEEIVGRYYLVDLGIEINAAVKEPSIIYINKDGSITGEDTSGAWEIDEENQYFDITYRDETFSGIVSKTKDEAGVERIVFSVVGQNRSLWGVKG